MKHLFALVLASILIPCAAQAAGPALPTSSTAAPGLFEVQTGDYRGLFTECSFGNQTEVTEHKIVTREQQELVRKVPGRQKFTDLTCTRGLTPDDGLWKWRQMIVDGKIANARQNIALSVYDNSSASLVGRWTLANAWPISISVAVKDQQLVEVVVFTAEGMQRDQ